MLSTSTHVGAKNPPWFRRQDQLVALLSGSECQNSANRSPSQYVRLKRAAGSGIVALIALRQR